VAEVVAVRAEPVDDDRGRVVLDAREPLVRLVEVVEGIAAAVVAVAGDEVLRLRGVHPRRERVRRESGEHDAVGRADSGARQHRDRQLRNHRHVHRHHVVLLDALIAERGRELVYLAVQLRVGVRPVVLVDGLTDPLDGDLVAAVVEVSVEAVGRRVQLAAREPLVEGRVAVVEHLVVVGFPVEQVSRPSQHSGQFSSNSS